MEVEIDGQMREVIVVAFDQDTPKTLQPVIKAVALVDANTGESLRCYPAPTDYSISSGPLVVVSDWGRFFFAMTTEQTDASIPEGVPGVLTVWSGGPGGGFERTFGADTVALRVRLQDGQLILHTTYRWAGLDLVDGTPYWSTERDTGVAVHEKLFFSPCGDIEVSGVPSQYEPPLAVGDSVILMQIGTSSADLVVQKAGVETFREPRCFNPVTLSAERAACIKVSSDGQSAEIVSFNLDGTERRTVPLGIDDPHNRLYFDRRLVAGEGGVVLVGVIVEPNPTLEGRYGRLLAVDTQNSQLRWNFRYESESHQSGGNNTGYPLLTPRGVYYTNMAIQTDVFGLAPSAFPRGWRGGNENRGEAVELPVP